MSQISSVLHKADGGMLMFLCPGCGCAHGVHVGEGPGPRWTWNGNAEQPTFTPSVLVRYEHWIPPARPGQPAPELQTLVTDVCHSFVTDGRIQFLSDCTHALAGKTVDLPAWD